MTLLETGAALSTAALMTLLINFRHLVYGLSMLEKFRGMGLRNLSVPRSRLTGFL